MKTSKAPWFVPDGFDCSVGCNIRPGPDGVGVIWDTVADGLTVADAKLISSAPTMLDTLLELRIFLANVNVRTLSETIHARNIVNKSINLALKGSK
jgi:hypothetical protein